MLAIWKKKDGYACGYSREGSGNDHFHGLFCPMDLTWAIGNLKIRLSQVSFVELFTKSTSKRKARRARAKVLFDLLHSDSKELKVRLIEGLCASKSPCLPRYVYQSSGFKSALAAYVSERKVQIEKLAHLSEVINALGATHGLRSRAGELQKFITEIQVQADRVKIAEEREELQRKRAQLVEREEQVKKLFVEALGGGPDSILLLTRDLFAKQPSAFRPHGKDLGDDFTRKSQASCLFFGNIRAEGPVRSPLTVNFPRPSTPVNLPCFK